VKLMPTSVPKRAVANNAHRRGVRGAIAEFRVGGGNGLGGSVYKGMLSEKASSCVH